MHKNLKCNAIIQQIISYQIFLEFIKVKKQTNQMIIFIILYNKQIFRIFFTLNLKIKHNKLVFKKIYFAINELIHLPYYCLIEKKFEFLFFEVNFQTDLSKYFDCQ
jgi:hypothetical protein